MLYDDSVWEGPESLKVDLGIERGAAGSLGVEISEEASSTQVIIDDPEDGEYHFVTSFNTSLQLSF